MKKLMIAVRLQFAINLSYYKHLEDKLYVSSLLLQLTLAITVGVIYAERAEESSSPPDNHCTVEDDMGVCESDRIRSGAVARMG